jgi:signal transduction histidine kinase/DNA-binding response OmpR family regulator
MNTRLLQTVISIETDIVLVRQRTRHLATLIGFDRQDQTRITTAVSEIARNAFEYAGGGVVEFHVIRQRPAFVIVVRDKGPGIVDLDGVLSGARKSSTGLGIGLIGARRLMDDFDIQSKPGDGTTVRLEKRLPRGVAAPDQALVQRWIETLVVDRAIDPMVEIRQQNQQILLQLQELRDRQEDLEKLNQELQETNRGVVALYAELDERADHLRRADELKSKFLSHMSHEFRTPLNSILALSRLLLARNDGDLTPEQDKQVQFIRKGAEDLTELVNDLLDLAKVEAGKTVVSPSVFTIDDLFATLRGMLRPLLVGDAVALVFEDNPSLPAMQTDEGKVSQILRNFISNAIKYTERGQVRVWASRVDDVSVQIFVRDTGIGIAPGDKELIFQEFGQVSHRLQSRVKGTGLGLPLARKLAELLGGQIDVESELGAGSTFSVTLPCAYPGLKPEADLMVSLTVEPGKLLVLLIEDNAADAFVVERILVGSAYQLVHAASLQQASVVLSHVKPAAIILDVLMATEESWRFLMELRQREHLDTPIIVTSSTDDARKAMHLGADAYLGKPMEAASLTDMLDRVTGRGSVVRVFLLDDEEIARYLIRQLLPRGRFSLTTAANGEDALILLENERPDVILLDLNMPGMDGWGFLDRLRALPVVADVPVIIVSSSVLDSEDRHRLQSVAGLLPKSDLSPERLEQVIRDAVGETAHVVGE